MSDLVEIVRSVVDADIPALTGSSIDRLALDWKAHRRQHFERLSASVLSAIEKAGYRIVPVEPTPEMENAADNCLRYCEECKEGTSHPVVIWPAMLAAAPKVS